MLLVGIGHISERYVAGRTKKRAPYYIWLIITSLTVLFTLIALVYIILLTARYDHQVIDINVTSTLNNKPYPDYIAHPKDFWTPENWLTAMLQLYSKAAAIEATSNTIFRARKVGDGTLYTC